MPVDKNLPAATPPAAQHQQPVSAEHYEPIEEQQPSQNRLFVPFRWAADSANALLHFRRAEEVSSAPALARDSAVTDSVITANGAHITETNMMDDDSVQNEEIPQQLKQQLNDRVANDIGSAGVGTPFPRSEDLRGRALSATESMIHSAPLTAVTAAADAYVGSDKALALTPDNSERVENLVLFSRLMAVPRLTIQFPVMAAAAAFQAVSALGTDIAETTSSLSSSLLPTLRWPAVNSSKDEEDKQRLETEFIAQYQSFVSCLPSLLDGAFERELHQFVNEFASIASRLSDEGQGQEMFKFIRAVVDSHFDSLAAERATGGVKGGETALPNACLSDFMLGDEDDRDRLTEFVETYLTTELYASIFCPTRDHRERDRQLFSRLSALAKHVTPNHLEIPVALFPGGGSLPWAAGDYRWLDWVVDALEALQLMTTLKCPHDKLVQLSNCCKIIFQALAKALMTEPSADDFVPVLAFLVLNANAPLLHSNVVYLTHFRDPMRLNGEQGYFFVSLLSVISFLESLSSSQDDQRAKLTHSTSQAGLEFSERLELTQRREQAVLAGHTDGSGRISIRMPPRVSLFSHPPPLVDVIPERFWNSMAVIFPEVGVHRVRSVKVSVLRHDSNDAVMTGNKARKMEFVLAEALEQGASRLWTIGGLQSNHARTVAAACARFGLDCHWVCRTPTGAPPERHDATASAPYSNLGGNFFLAQNMFGARLHFCTPEQYREGPHLINRLRREDDLKVGNNKAYEIPEGASFSTGMWGYIDAFIELVPYLESQVAAGTGVHRIVVAVGSGGTLAGLVLGQYLATKFLNPRLSREHIRITGIVICDDASYFSDRITGQIQATVAKYIDFGFEADDFSSFNPEEWFELWDGYVGAGYATASSAQIRTMQACSATTGIAFDPTYSGKAWYGLVDRVLNARIVDENVLFVHTGGLFGLLAQWENFVADGEEQTKETTIHRVG